MSDSVQPNLQELFLQAIEIPEVDRNLWLNEHCTDQAMRNELAELLQFHDQHSLALDKGALPHSTHATVKKIGPNELHTTCPHCDKQIVVLADSLLTSITCLACKKTFSLVDGLAATEIDGPTIKVGRFELLSQLGEGAFGSVWMAHDPELERKVALKLPRNGRLSHLEAELFFREARAAAQLHHENIVPIHEVGRDGDAVFIVSELVRGTDLEDWLSTNQLGNREASQLCRTIALALHHAHEQGVIHRDLKPSNIMIDHDGKPYLMDFGLAKRESQEIAMTVEGQPIGTPSYMSPEQAAGDSQLTDHRTDIYSLGVLLFRVLTGELPYRGNQQVQMYKRQTEDAPDPRKLNPGITRDLATICLKCLEREPNKRYVEAHDVADELDRYLGGHPIEARPIPKLSRVFRLAKRRKAATLAAVLTLFLAIAGPSFAINYRNQYVALEREKRQKENAILGNHNEKEDYTREIEKWRRLAEEGQQEIDYFEGNANSLSSLIRKTEGVPGREELISKFYAASKRTIAHALQANENDLNDVANAQVYLGLAILAQTIESTDDAKAYFALATKSLTHLCQAFPDEAKFHGALALCETYSAKFNGEGNEEVAFDQLSNASRIYKELIETDGAEATYAIALSDVELLLASMPQYASPANHLATIAEVYSHLDNNWPEGPAEFYRLACYLTSEFPVLLSNDPHADQ